MSINISKQTSVESDASTRSPSCLNSSLQPQNFQLTGLVLGEGGFGTVFQGKNLKNSALVAIKVFNDIESAAIQDRLFSRLQGSKNALKYYGSYFNETHKATLVFQQFGVSLKQFLQTQNLPFLNLLQIFESIVRCVEQLKLLGVIHRDLKPENILIKNCATKQKKYAVKICDLGLATQFDSTSNKSSFAKLGTISYKSPQTIQFGQNTYKSEIWSLGIIFYQMLHNKLPFQRQCYYDQQLLYHKLLLGSIQFDESPEIARQIGKMCLNPNSQKRISIEELLSQLNKAINSLKNESKIFQNSEPNLKKQQNVESLLHEIVGLFEQLKQRVNSLKGIMAIQKKLMQMCNKIFEAQPHTVPDLLKLTNKTLLLEYLKKMKIIAKFSQTQKQIRFNIKQFMIIDTLLLVMKLLKYLQKKEYSEVCRALEEYAGDNKNQQNQFNRFTRVFEELREYQQ